MKVINERSQSEERAGVSACPVIRRILKELYMHICQQERSVIQRMMRTSYTRRAGSLFVLKLSVFIVRAYQKFLFAKFQILCPFNFDDHLLISLFNCKLKLIYTFNRVIRVLRNKANDHGILHSTSVSIYID